MRTAVVDDVSTNLSCRDLQLIRAVADRRVECTASGEPDFFVDGVAYCDHLAARTLVRAGLIRAADLGSALRLPVQVTSVGRDALSAHAAL